MFVILGLGNPGPDYAHTRHNVGFDVVDALQNAECKTQNAEWKNKKLLHAETLECTIGTQRVVLAKPTTFMNESGKAAFALVRSSRLPTLDSRLVVIHDDLDLASGTLRLSTNGSSGGHKGIQSIIESLGTKDFLRLRIGIGPNTTPDGTRIPAEDFVLKRFTKSERPRIDAAVAKACEVLEVLVREGADAAHRSLS